MTSENPSGRSASDKILADLQQVYPNLSPQLRRAAHYLIERPDEIAFTSMRQLAERADVQPATMVMYFYQKRRKQNGWRRVRLVADIGGRVCTSMLLPDGP